MTDCANNGSFISVRFVRIGCRLDIQVHTCSIHEAVFGFKEAGLKLDVTTWVPRFTQSVFVLCCIYPGIIIITRWCLLLSDDELGAPYLSNLIYTDSWHDISRKGNFSQITFCLQIHKTHVIEINIHFSCQEIACNIKKLASSRQNFWTLQWIWRNTSRQIKQAQMSNWVINNTEFYLRILWTIFLVINYFPFPHPLWTI